ncbi:hypothetical protein GUITHDRAFT_115135 [Guillardia theta CCMP2712]|uniref:Armadillo repeat-containing domain-containing protein n=1 Tax=Guillardia theta (strain CCMP2712) TaxID=905079 RepID=L1IRF5_GUITC|nr:hypothetical protein GUITHDRAFT_115135 [Guillardia theta CCMP2712]EKX38808.1 hypothetical protein GUITHDRAFT_115135 [Guillardia theta CCMP2712]|eukprot:XP_005825788.1 hypothetical protein GUITHDRAFT_115135 [Guillardia theta CCMP2712]
MAAYGSLEELCDEAIREVDLVFELMEVDKKLTISEQGSNQPTSLQPPIAFELCDMSVVGVEMGTIERVRVLAVGLLGRFLRLLRIINERSFEVHWRKLAEVTVRLVYNCSTSETGRLATLKENRSVEEVCRTLAERSKYATPEVAECCVGILCNLAMCHPEQRGERIINASGHKEIVRVIDDAKVSGHVVLQAIIAVQNLSFQNEYAQRQLTVSGAIGALITRLKITFKEGLSSLCDESCTRTSEFVVTAMRNLLVNNVDGKRIFFTSGGLRIFLQLITGESRQGSCNSALTLHVIGTWFLCNVKTFKLPYAKHELESSDVEQSLLSDPHNYSVPTLLQSLLLEADLVQQVFLVIQHYLRSFADRDPLLLSSACACFRNLLSGSIPARKAFAEHPDRVKVLITDQAIGIFLQLISTRANMERTRIERLLSFTVTLGLIEELCQFLTFDEVNVDKKLLFATLHCFASSAHHHRLLRSLHYVVGFKAMGSVKEKIRLLDQSSATEDHAAKILEMIEREIENCRADVQSSIRPEEISYNFKVGDIR